MKVKNLLAFDLGQALAPEMLHNPHHSAARWKWLRKEPDCFSVGVGVRYGAPFFLPMVWAIAPKCLVFAGIGMVLLIYIK